MTELKWPGNKIRATFLKFFEERGHKIVRSSSLVPANDPTLLFTNAGMNQFKDVFLGLEQRDYNRATTCQKCVRAGGKHNDLENVGFTNRHHTFFEMLGNFSFGASVSELRPKLNEAYFKPEAIEYAWELITSSPNEPRRAEAEGAGGFGIPVDKLYFTVFGGAELIPLVELPSDHDARDLWIQTGAPKDRVFEIPGLKENFWAMGDTGPCGPCSEIFYDMGVKAVDTPQSPECSAGNCKFPCDCGRYVEIWNLVFMQFNRYCNYERNGYPSGWDEKKKAEHQHSSQCLKVEPLPRPSVDTGMGLERVAAVLQNKISNFDTDLFTPLMDEAAKLCSADRHKPENQPSLRIIADHFRAATFLIADGVVPSNEGRGYVLRKILRRAFTHAWNLNPERFPYVSHMAGAVREEMAETAYHTELDARAVVTSKVLDAEEERFTRTVETGLKELNTSVFNDAVTAWSKYRMELQKRDLARSKQVDRTMPIRREDDLRGVAVLRDALRDVLGVSYRFSGKEAFRLYDTFGLPRDFIEDVVRDVGLQVEWDEFDKAMAEQQARSKASWKGAHKEAASPVYRKLADTFKKTEPEFYRGTETRDSKIQAIVANGNETGALKAGQEGEIVLDRTAIYSESGGQVADTGKLFDPGMSLEVAEVRGAYYPVAGLIAHRIVAKEDLAVGDRVATVADAARRERVMRNHSGTHLVHAALRNILGTHVKQAGSLNAPDHLRFDFSHFTNVGAAELLEIEQQVNEEIRRDLPFQTDVMNIEDALASGALAFFGDKYPEQNVRVVTIADAAYPRGFYSKELWGGTHVGRTGEIGVFKIALEQSVAAGVRRIEALTGDAALAKYQSALGTLRTLAEMLNTGEDR
ncbi:MAG TPA: alanine--tRNA ligase, partial [Candidatus Acidoferrum sp.]|nr:alanine--tRNA ligase [Candidatus Acidoferrum sp.]